MRKGFTLIEIVIVIAIISILMTVTMKFGSGRINLLQYQTNKEEFVADYDQLHTQTLTSNYRNGIRFETMKIKLSNDADQIGYAFDDWDFQTNNLNADFMISWLQLDGNDIGEAQLLFTPYENTLIGKLRIHKYLYPS